VEGGKPKQHKNHRQEAKKQKQKIRNPFFVLDLKRRSEEKEENTKGAAKKTENKLKKKKTLRIRFVYTSSAVYKLIQF
jgi:hypothetical protein